MEDVPEAEHGFVENFMQLFSLRDRLRKMRDEISENGFCCKYPSLLGNTIFNTTVSFKSGFFEKLIAPFVEELNLNDRKTASKYMVQSLKAQINSLKIVMNDAYLKFVNVTLYKEVISKNISPSVSQFVLVALARAGMVVISKHLLEILISRRELVKKQKENSAKQKALDLDQKLKVMQESTDKQLDDKISGKIDQNVSKTVRTILSTDLTPNAFKANKKTKKSKNISQSIDGNVNTAIPDQENKNEDERKKQAVPVPSIAPIVGPQFLPQQTVMDANGQQFIIMPFNQGQFQPTLNAQMGGPAFNAGRNQARGQLRGRGRSGRFRRGFTRHSGIFDAYSMDTAPINIFENQVLPTGLHDVSKSFRPNLATTRVFSMGTKFIPVWKNTKIWKPFSKFQDFRRRMNNKMFFEETTPGVFERNRKFGLKNNWWASTQYKEIDEFCYKTRDGIANIIDSKNILNVQNMSKLEFSG